MRGLGENSQRDSFSDGDTPRTPMTAEQKQQRLERKKAMRSAIRDMTNDRSVLTTPTQRIKVKVAAAYVKRSKIGRLGPAEGSVLDTARDDRAALLRNRHVTMAAIDRDTLRAVAAGSQPSSPRRSMIDEASPVMAPPMIRRWTSSESVMPVSWKTPSKGQILHRHVEPQPLKITSEYSFDWSKLDACKSPDAREAEARPEAGAAAGAAVDAEIGVEAHPGAAVAAVAAIAAAPRGAGVDVAAAADADAVKEAGAGQRSSSCAGAPAGTTTASSAAAAAPQQRSASLPADPAPADVPTGEEAIDEEPELVVADDTVVVAMAGIVGDWKCVQTSNLEKYLKHIGLGWAKRKLAAAFSPEPSFKIDDHDGVLQVGSAHGGAHGGAHGSARTRTSKRTHARTHARTCTQAHEHTRASTDGLRTRCKHRSRQRRRFRPLSPFVRSPPFVITCFRSSPSCCSVPHVDPDWRPPRAFPSRLGGGGRRPSQRDRLREALLLGGWHAGDHGPRSQWQEGGLCDEALRQRKRTARADQRARRSLHAKDPRDEVRVI